MQTQLKIQITNSTLDDIEPLMDDFNQIQGIKGGLNLKEHIDPAPIIELSFQIGIGVTSSIIANILFDFLKKENNKNKTSITINNNIEITQSDKIEIIEKKVTQIINVEEDD